MKKTDTVDVMFGGCCLFVALLMGAGALALVFALWRWALA